MEDTSKLRYIKAQVAVVITMTLASCINGNDSSPRSESGSLFHKYPQPGSHEHFTANPSYPQTRDIYVKEELLALTDPSNSRIIVSLSKQRGFLVNGDEVVMDYPVSTGKPSRPTPAGNYTILEKIVKKRSNAYGTVYDSTGLRTEGETPSSVPSGGSFVGAPMPYWMRLTWKGIGHHIGHVPRYAASHACIRGPRTVIPVVFSKTKIGTRFTIEN